jgi:hypothetical protein
MSKERQRGSAPPKAVPPTQKPSGQNSAERGTESFAVYTLSRGTGVPPEARAAQQEIQKLVEADRDRGLVVRIETTRIGIEGERRLCVTYKDPRNGARALERARAIVKGVALINVEKEPCTQPASKTPKQEETA